MILSAIILLISPNNSGKGEFSFFVFIFLFLYFFPFIVQVANESKLVQNGTRFQNQVCLALVSVICSLHSTASIVGGKWNKNNKCPQSRTVVTARKSAVLLSWGKFGICPRRSFRDQKKQTFPDCCGSLLQSKTKNIIIIIFSVLIMEKKGLD